MLEKYLSKSNNGRDIVRELFESLVYIYGELGKGFQQKKLETTALIQSKSFNPRSPLMYHRTQQLVKAAQEGNESQVVKIAEDIHAFIKKNDSFQIKHYCQKELGEDYVTIADQIFGSSYGEQPIVNLDEEEFSKAKKNFLIGLELVKKYAPEADREVNTLWTKIFLGRANPNSGKSGFGGVTSLMLWGAAFVNVDSYNTPLRAAECIVHEVTHALLFALNASTLLVLNPISGRYSSPLRSDPRPMDGIYHATIVCARVASFYEAMAQDESNAKDLRNQAQELYKRNQTLFLDGYKTISSDGKLSDLAEEILSEANLALSKPNEKQQ